jgi:CxxC-x17-CxxC domain-containing protein
LKQAVIGREDIARSVRVPAHSKDIMDYAKDEQLTCADCGAPFLFTAAEAAFYAERNLAAPPKRCKECRRARKEQRGRGDAAPRGGRGLSHEDAPPARRAGREGPRYTGSANEYRSPMQDNVYYSPPAWGRSAAPAAGAPRARGWAGDAAPRLAAFRDRPQTDGYRSPSFRGGARADGDYRAPSYGGAGGVAPRAPAPNGNHRSPSFHDGPSGYGERGGPARSFQGDRAPSGRRFDGPRFEGGDRRAQGPMFDITCSSCGVQARVPFEPAEGRDVFCQACYRARRPLRHDGGHGHGA